MKSNIGNRIKERRLTIILSVAFSFVLFLYAPIEMYLNNLEDVSYDIYDVIVNMLPVFVLSTLILSALFMLMKDKARSVLVLVLTVFLIASYIQGTFMSDALSVIDNRDVDWSIFSVQRIQTIIVWVLLLLTGLVLLKRGMLEKTAAISSALLAAILLVSIALMSMNGGLTDKKDIRITDNGITDMSADRNFVILVLDSVDSTAFGNAVSQDDFPDFTFYRNTVSTYLETKYSVPFIISGQWYRMERPFWDYEKDAYSSSELFDMLDGYDVRMFYRDLPGMDAVTDRFENVEPAGFAFEKPAEFIKMQMMLSGLKHLPYDLKKFCVLDTEQTYEYSEKQGVSNAFTGNNDEFLKNLEDGISVSDGRKFRFILLDGAHMPFVEDSYEKSVEKCIEISKEYLDALKKAEVYDNSIIIIMADHGCNGLDIEGRQFPLLMIKGYDEHHDFVVSDAPISYEDLMDAYKALLKGDRNLFSYGEGEQRTRTYLSHYELKTQFVEKEE